MKQIRNFFSSKWVLVIPMLFVQILSVVLITINFDGLDPDWLNYYYCLLFFFYFLLGLAVVPKINEKKKALMSTVAFGTGVNLAILILWLLFCKVPIINLFLGTLTFSIWYQNPFSYGMCLMCFHFAESPAFFAVITTLVSPIPVLFVYLFSKTPLLFKFLKRIRIKKSGKSITFYIKEIEAEK